jgi:hypothetical protein
VRWQNAWMSYLAQESPVLIAIGFCLGVSLTILNPW